MFGNRSAKAKSQAVRDRATLALVGDETPLLLYWIFLDLRAAVESRVVDRRLADWRPPHVDHGAPRSASCREGTEALICQDTRLGGLGEVLARAKVRHDPLVDPWTRTATPSTSSCSADAIAGMSPRLIHWRPLLYRPVEPTEGYHRQARAENAFFRYKSIAVGFALDLPWPRKSKRRSRATS